MVKIVLKDAKVDPHDNSIRCVDCGHKAVLTEVLEHKPGGHYKSWYRVCACGAHYSASSSGRPTSKPADGHTRYLRVLAHQAFDRLWQCSDDPDFLAWLEKTTRNRSRATGRVIGTRRRKCYHWLAVQLGLKHHREASIGQLNAAQCMNVVTICEDATWAQVEAWHQQNKDKSREPSKATIHRRKPKRRPPRILGPEDDDGEHWR